MSEKQFETLALGLESLEVLIWVLEVNLFHCHVSCILLIVGILQHVYSLQADLLQSHARIPVFLVDNLKTNFTVTVNVHVFGVPLENYGGRVCWVLRRKGDKTFEDCPFQRLLISFEDIGILEDIGDALGLERLEQKNFGVEPVLQILAHFLPLAIQSLFGFHYSIISHFNWTPGFNQSYIFPYSHYHSRSPNWPNLSEQSCYECINQSTSPSSLAYFPVQISRRDQVLIPLLCATQLLRTSAWTKRFPVKIQYLGWDVEIANEENIGSDYNPIAVVLSFFLKSIEYTSVSGFNPPIIEFQLAQILLPDKRTMHA